MTQYDPAKARHIDDLRQPRLNREQQAAIDYARGLKLELSVDAVLEAARKATGMDDFGADDFKERLAVQLQSALEDSTLNNIGRLTIFNELVQNASNRLRLEDLLRRHPEILDLPLPRPVIIAGLPRSGTTHLVNMIAADQRFRSMPLWESQQPVPTPGEPATRDHRDPRFERSRKAWEQQDAMLPLLKNMHPMDPEHIHEEIALQCLDFSSYVLEWIATLPRWRDHYLASDQTPSYRYMRKALQALTWQQGPDRWVLKSPQHLEQLVPLHTVFPDATIAITHRDPVAVISSTLTMLAYGSRLRCDTIDMEGLRDYWVERVEKLLRACVRDRERLPAGQSLDILFDDFMADDIGTVEQIYHLAGIPMTDTARRQLEHFLEAHPRGRYGQILYDLEGDFGISPARLRERFSFYYERYPALDPG